MQCKYCEVDLKPGFASPESPHLDWTRRSAFYHIHKDAHKKLILVMKCPKCGHSEKPFSSGDELCDWKT
jgi:uncharacterized OB-fold protein